ncbi:glycosyltransferase family 22 protein [Hypholoma sublateritium FD-334 SS-4]|uniref:Mannosyltransferase n=1 Tax=Hypholoma sublateritium (strain FD-334 SS-4) TaxID=945553 RepID=A0A0D2LCJ2_HYPSF|nr:glycosyltransferase family 22 protein [Hypholoma sublateritium FD-334 SS-4]
MSTSIVTFSSVNAPVFRTFFQPDEYFQSLEPAHKLVFGYGHLTWEWMISQPIRSIIYPALNVPIYYFLKVTGLSELGQLGDLLLLVCPQILHGGLAACTDIHLGKTARAILGSDYSSTAMFISLASFFHALALSRSLSNSLETSLCTIAFSCYPWDAHSKLSMHIIYNRFLSSIFLANFRHQPCHWYRSKLRKMILFSALACTIRPTNAAIRVHLYANLLWAVRNYRRISLLIIGDIFIACSLPIAFLFTVDSLYYQTLALTPFNFLKRNMSDVSLFYGAYAWHYYITQAILIQCTTALPFTLHGMWTTATSKIVHNTPLRTMLATVIWTVGYLGLVLATVPLSLYVILFYYSGPISVSVYIQSIRKDQLNITTIGVLMPCHSIPGHANIHREELAHGRMWSLGCEPPLKARDNLSTYKDQTNVFFDSPSSYLHTYFPPHVNQSFPLSPFPTSPPGVSSTPSVLSTSGQLIHPWRHEWPTHLVFFANLLHEEGYKEVWKAGREWEGEGVRKGGARVWRWSA